MRSRLGVYWAPGHNRPSDLAYMRQLQPAMIRILDPDVAQVSAAHEAAPNALLALRFWVLDDNAFQQQERMQGDPEGFADFNAAAQISALARLEDQARERGLSFPKRDRVLLNAVNEPTIWGAERAARRAKADRYNACFGPQIEQAGAGALLGCINGGHPDEWPPVWDWFARSLAWLETSQRSYLELHEYWQPEGPDAVWTDEAGRERRDGGALAWRHRHLPASVRIVIGECGCDGVIYGRHAQRNRGWRAFMNAATYAEQLVAYTNGCDGRVTAVLPFLTDYRENQDNAWDTFDTGPAHDEIVARRDQLVTPAAYLPFVSGIEPDMVHNEDSVSQMVHNEPTGIIDPVVLEAILQIESGGAGLSDGRVTIRFEPHIFQTYLGNETLFAKHFRYGSPIWTQREFNRGDGWRSMEIGGQSVQWEAYELARGLNAEAAAMSVSMGAAQIMGFNHKSVGYESAQAMLRAFRSEAVQIIAFLNFVLGRPDLLHAVRNRDWRTIARTYNGAGNVSRYAELLEKAYLALAGRD